tara:strand:- start:207 stop:338 length:132 start_codon:yes stop_codon:yes gene_type:complete
MSITQKLIDRKMQLLETRKSTGETLSAKDMKKLTEWKLKQKKK